ncbi:hypothetical protein FRB91_003800 [Serendipita sp. 411]|nr:hypothetical protein FRB91_003800 [Serendipita sp. 411]
MRFAVLATIFATAASIAIAAPVQTTEAKESTAAVVKASESTEHLATVQPNTEVTQKTLNHTPNHESKKEKEEKHGEHPPEEEHLFPRNLTEEQARENAKHYGTLSKNLAKSSNQHQNNANHIAAHPNGDPVQWAQEQGKAVDHANGSIKAGHYSDMYTHTADQIRHQGNANTARLNGNDRLAAKHDKKAYNSGVLADHYKDLGDGIQANI